MDDKVHIVEQNPIAFAATFDGVGHDAELLFEPVLDLVGDGDGLTIVRGRGDQKKVREAGVDRVEFEDAGLFAFFVFTGRGCGLRSSFGLQALQPQS
jgi:endonuclease YncB( thermonuclease family)